MQKVRITVKNYRPFTDDNPLQIDLASGFTALVGQNNTGKSSFVKLFYELRNFWGGVIGNFQAIFMEDWRLGVNYMGISDDEELFSNINSRPLSIELEILGKSQQPDPDNPSLVRVIATCERDSRKNWRFSCFSSVDPAKAIKISPDISSLRKTDSVVKLPGHYNIDCFDFLEVISLFFNTLYIGPFRNAITEGTADYFDLKIGSSFISTWNAWKTGGVKAQNRAIAEVTKNIQRIFEFEQLEINASESLKTLNIYVDGKPYLLTELGSGLAQFIVVFGNAAIKNPGLILIDEPELNLHPSLQIDFLTALASFSPKGIIFATHSIGLARSIAEKIYSFQKSNKGCVVRPFEGMRNYAEFLGEMSFSAFKDMGFDRVLLVEGVNDVKTIQQFLRMLKKDHQTVILPLGGDQLARGGVEVELSEITRLSDNVFALVDSERPAKGKQASKKRREFKQTCQALRISVCLTERRAMENYLTDEAVKSALGKDYASLRHYQRLKDCPIPWRKSNSWRVARKMNFDDIGKTDVGRFLSNI